MAERQDSMKDLLPRSGSQQSREDSSQRFTPTPQELGEIPRLAVRHASYADVTVHQQQPSSSSSIGPQPSDVIPPPGVGTSPTIHVSGTTHRPARTPTTSLGGVGVVGDFPKMVTKTGSGNLHETRTVTPAPAAGGGSKSKFSFEAVQDSAPHIWVVEQEIGKHATMKTFPLVADLHHWAREVFSATPAAPKERSDAGKLQRQASRTEGVPDSEEPGHESQIVVNEEDLGIPRVPTSYGHDDITTNWRPTAKRHGSTSSSTSSVSSLTDASEVKFAKQKSVDQTEPEQEEAQRVHSRSSSSSSSSEPEITHTYWLDVQSGDLDVLEPILAMFPVEDDCLDRMSVLQDVDTLQVCASENYVALNVQCKKAEPTVANRAGLHDQDTAEDVYVARPFRPQHYLTDPGTQAACSILLFEDWIITIHSSPVAGLADLLRKIEGKYGSHRFKRLRARARQQLGGAGAQFRYASVPDSPSPSFAGFPGVGGGGGSSPLLLDAAGGLDLMRTSWVCAMLVDFIISHTLPDPSPLLAEADACDEMSLMTTMDDQMDMLVRLSGLRRRISQQQSFMYQKEKLLHQFLAPELRTTFVARHNTIAEVYSRAQGQVVRIAERLNAAREVMSHASSNLASNVSLQQAEASNQMNAKMKVLSQVASICLPLNIITGAFGMNVSVPFQTDKYPNTVGPFLVIVAVMVIWLLVSFPSIVYFGKKRRGGGHTQAHRYG